MIINHRVTGLDAIFLLPTVKMTKQNTVCLENNDIAFFFKCVSFVIFGKNDQKSCG